MKKISKSLPYRPFFESLPNLKKKNQKMSDLNFFWLYQVENLILRTIKIGSFGLKLILKGVGVILNMAVGRGWRPEG